MIIDSNNMIGTYKGHSLRTVDMLLDEMNSANVDYALVSCFPSKDENELVLSAIRSYPDRLSGMYSANPYAENSDGAYKEALKNGFTSLRLNPLAHGYRVNDITLLAPLLDVCAESGTPVWIYGTADVYCAPVLFQDLAEAFPEVPMVIGYMGFNYEASSAIRIAKEYANVYLDSTAAMKQNLIRAVSDAGAEKILFGSGTPVASYFELEINKINSVVEDSEGRECILWKNAARLFHIQVSCEETK